MPPLSDRQYAIAQRALRVYAVGATPHKRDDSLVLDDGWDGRDGMTPTVGEVGEVMRRLAALVEPADDPPTTTTEG